MCGGHPAGPIGGTKPTADDVGRPGIRAVWSIHRDTTGVHSKGIATMAEEFETAQGISRRDMLQKSAIIGGAGALAWAAPSITKYGGAAFGDSDGTPMGKGISYIALQYSCDLDAEGKAKPGSYRYIKFDDYSEGTFFGWKCQTGNFSTPGCSTSWDNSGATEYPGDCSKFTLEVLNSNDDGEPTSVKVCLPNEECVITGSAYGKCGAPEVEQSEGACITRTAVDGCVIFDMCIAD